MMIGMQGKVLSGNNENQITKTMTAVERYEETKQNLILPQDTAKDEKEESAAFLEISDEAKETYLAFQTGLRDLENANEQGEAMREHINEMGKAMIIFRRIAHGDKVPLRDERKLMEYDDKLYQMAKQAAMMAKNDKPKKYKSLYEDEDKNSVCTEAAEENAKIDEVVEEVEISDETIN